MEAGKQALAAAKESATLPEHLLQSRRAEVAKRGAALAAATRSLEEKEQLLAKLAEETEQLRQTMAAEAAAFRAAESALEAAQRRLASAVGPSAAAAKTVVCDKDLAQRRGHAVSDRGVTALQDLSRHIGGLTSIANVAGAQLEYEALAAAHFERGEEPPGLCQFLFNRLQEEGSKLVDAVSFEILRPETNMANAELPHGDAGAPASVALGTARAQAAVPAVPTRGRPLHGGYSPYKAAEE